ncbi:type VI secretion system baseplate subunit TssK [Algicola sagamiensis]|uniref:type VI secretion system baseplate subunit TssK n=1 Tax=Algicola sagamiensis TaxID=163869 RepID=UPI00036D3824|nr:type VI secretion system baseplate subunit TssK [Algicola sagamiensis]
MSDFTPIAWTEGMFLRPQHFQQTERYLLNNIHRAIEYTTPYHWGFQELKINHAMLSQGEFQLEHAIGLMPDHTLIHLPVHDPLPLGLKIDREVRNQVIHLAIPSSKTKTLNISENGNMTITRFQYEDHTSTDISVGSEAQELLQVAKLNLSFKLSSEDLTGFITMPVARILEVTGEGQIKLDSHFIPPCLTTDNSPLLEKLINEVKGLIQQRAKATAQLLNQENVTGSVTDFLKLQVLNKHEPAFIHFQDSASIHPYMLYQRLTDMIGELSTYCLATKRVPELPKYDHHNLGDIFDGLKGLTNQLLSHVLEQTAQQIQLERSQVGIFHGAIRDKGLLNQASFVLAIKANVPEEEMRQHIPRQTKIGPVETIRDFINNQIPGITLKPLLYIPRQVKHYDGFIYFQLDKSNEHWGRLANSGGIAIHFAGNYPNLNIMLWAIRN